MASTLLSLLLNGSELLPGPIPGSSPHRAHGARTCTVSSSLWSCVLPGRFLLCDHCDDDGFLRTLTTHSPTENRHWPHWAVCKV